MTKAILINPTLKTINLIEVGEYDHMQKLINGMLGGVGYIKPNGVVGDYSDDFIYVNDEGLFDETTDFVKIPNYAQEYYRGNMLIVGSDGEGGTTDVKMTLNEAKVFIQYVPKEAVVFNM